jgi:TfoX/Sxy family transcriptional regulator of competence genes
MPTWEKPSRERLAQLADALQGYGCSPRTMFGTMAYFVHGNMFAGVLGTRIMLRMAPSDREMALALAGDEAIVAPMGRRLREYVYVPEAAADDPDQLADWVARSYAYVEGLPAKDAAHS